MKTWTSHSLMLNGKQLNPLRLTTLIANESDSLVINVLEFFKEWIREEEWLYQQTSGSTGKPKTIPVSKKSMIESALATIHYFGLGKGLKALLCLSPDFIAGKMMIVRAMVSNMDLITKDVSANPIQNLDNYIGFAAMVPLQVNQILKQSPDKFRFIKTLIIGGSAIDPVLEKALQTIDTQCFHTYGMTETLSHIALRPINGINKTNWFTPLENIHISLDQRDCLVIQVPYIQDNPLLTNDLAEIDQYGNFKMLGRIDHVIVSAGRKIQPEEVERKIMHLFNKPFIISSVKDETAGEKIVLFCEQKHEIKALYQLWKQLSELLEPHQIPRQIIHLEKIPLLESGKTDRKGIIYFEK